MTKVMLLLTALIALCGAAFGQYAGVAVAPLNGPSYQPPSNPQHASQHEMRPEQSLFGTNGVSEAHGERPLWEFPDNTPAKPLGDVAREYRKLALYGTEKARIHWEKQGR